MSIQKSFFGRLPDGREASLYTLTAPDGSSAAVTDFGAHLVSVKVPDRNGTLAEVCLGFDCAEHYAVRGGSIGASVGRYANRIGRGVFTLNGDTYHLYINNGENCLHGGKEGFDKRMFTAEPLEKENTVVFSYVSPDMEEGFPGEMHLEIAFTWSPDHTLTIRYMASSSRDTVVNLTNHAYWNLNGSTDAKDQVLTVCSRRTTEVDDGLIPTGKILDISGTLLDLTGGRTVKEILSRAEESAPVRLVNGLDFNYCLSDDPGLKEAARLYDPASGREMTVLTTEPAIQAYSGQGLCTDGHGGASYGPFAGIALETQHYPDSPNHPEFPTTVLKAGDTFASLTAYRFSVR